VPLAFEICVASGGCRHGAHLHLALILVGWPLAHGVRHTSIGGAVEARLDLASGSGAVQEAVGVHLAINAQAGWVRAGDFQAFSTRRAPLAQRTSLAPLLVQDDAVVDTAFGRRKRVPDASRVGCTNVLVRGGAECA